MPSDVRNSENPDSTGLGFVPNPNFSIFMISSGGKRIKGSLPSNRSRHRYRDSSFTVQPLRMLSVESQGPRKKVGRFRKTRHRVNRDVLTAACVSNLHCEPTPSGSSFFYRRLTAKTLRDGYAATRLNMLCVRLCGLRGHGGSRHRKRTWAC